MVLRTLNGDFTTDNHVVLFTYKPINDRWHTLQLRQKLRLDIRVFSYSVYSTEKYMGTVHAEIEHLLKESNIRNPDYFVFANTSVNQCYCVGSTICSCGGSVSENEIT